LGCSQKKKKKRNWTMMRMMIGLMVGATQTWRDVTMVRVRSRGGAAVAEEGDEGGGFQRLGKSGSRPWRGKEPVMQAEKEAEGWSRSRRIGLEMTTR
jgi:hypothetical protein